MTIHTVSNPVAIIADAAENVINASIAPYAKEIHLNLPYSSFITFSRPMAMPPNITAAASGTIIYHTLADAAALNEYMA